MEDLILPTSQNQGGGVNAFLDELKKNEVQKFRESVGLPEPRTPEQFKETVRRNAQTARGGKSLAQMAAKKPGTFVYETNRIRTALKVKPGTEKDMALKGILADRAADGNISQEEYAAVVKMMTDGSYKREYTRLRERNARAHKVGRLPFDESDYLRALSMGDQVFKSNGKEFKTGVNPGEAEWHYQRLGIRPPAAQEASPLARELRDIEQGGPVPYEGQPDSNFKDRRERTLESAALKASAGAKAPFTSLADMVSPAFKQSRDALLREDIEGGRSYRDAQVNQLRAQDAQGDLASVALSLGSAGAGASIKALAGLDAVDIASQLPGAWARSKTDGLAETAPEIALVLLAGAFPAADLLREGGAGIKKAIQSPEFQKYGAEQFRQMGASSTDWDTVFKNIQRRQDDIAALADAPEVQKGLPQNTRDIPKASVTNAVEPEIPVQQLDGVQQTVNPSELPNSSVGNIADSARAEPDIPTQVDEALTGTPNKVEDLDVQSLPQTFHERNQARIQELLEKRKGRSPGGGAAGAGLGGFDIKTLQNTAEDIELGARWVIDTAVRAGVTITEVLQQVDSKLRPAIVRRVGEIWNLSGSDVDTRVITGVKSPLAENTERLISNMSHYDQMPQVYKDKLLEGLQKASPALAKMNSVEEVVDYMAENLLKIHDIADPVVREFGRMWYEGANNIANMFAARHGLTPDQVAGVLAVNSPQTDWYKNVSRAERIINIVLYHGDDVWTPEMTKFADNAKTAKGKHVFDMERVSKLEGKRLNDLTDDLDAAYFIRAFDEVNNPQQYALVTPDGRFFDYDAKANGAPKKFSWADFAQTENSLQILRDGNLIDDALGDQHKVRNFYNNIRNPWSIDPHLTADTHHANATLAIPQGGTYKSENPDLNLGTRHLFSTPNNADFGYKGLYPVHHEAGIRAAGERGVLPREMQSITWETVRQLFDKKSAGMQRKARAIWQDFSDGKISHAEAWEQILELSEGVSTPSWVSGLKTAPRGGSTYIKGDIPGEGAARAGRGGGSGTPQQPTAMAGDGGGGLSTGAVGDAPAVRKVLESSNKRLEDLLKKRGGRVIGGNAGAGFGGFSGKEGEYLLEDLEIAARVAFKYIAEGAMAIDDAIRKAIADIKKDGINVDEESVRAHFNKMAQEDEDISAWMQSHSRTWDPEFQQAQAEPARRATVAENERAAGEFGIGTPDLEKGSLQKYRQEITDKDLTGQSEELINRVQRGGALNPAETLALGDATASRQAELKSISNQLAQARRTGQTERIRELEESFNRLREETKVHSDAFRMARQKAGQTLQAGQNDVLRDAYDPATVQSMAEAVSPTGKVHPDVQAELDRLTTRNAELEAEVDKLVKEAARDKAREAVKGSPRSGRRSKAVIQASLKSNAKKFADEFAKNAGGPVGSGLAKAPFTAGQVEALKGMARDLIELGVVNLEEGIDAVVDGIRRQLKDLTGQDYSQQDIVDGLATPGPGKTRSEIQKQMDDLRRQARNDSTGTKEQRAARQKVLDAKKKAREAARAQAKLNKAAGELDNAADKARADKLARDEKYWNDTVKTLQRQAEKDFGEEWRFHDRIFKIDEEIADLENQMATGAFRKPEKPIRPERDKFLEEKLAELAETRRNIDRAIAANEPSGNWEYARLVARGLGFTNPVARVFDVTANAFKMAYETASKPVDFLIESTLFPGTKKGTALPSYNRARRASKGYWSRVGKRMSDQFKHGDNNLLQKIDIRKQANLKARFESPGARKVAGAVDATVNFFNRTPGYTDIPFHQRAFDIAVQEGIDKEVAYMKRANKWSKAEAENFRQSLMANENGLLEPIKLAAQEIADELVWANTTAFDELMSNIQSGIKRWRGKETGEGVMFAFDTLITRYPTIFAKILGYGTDHIYGVAKAGKRLWGLKKAGQKASQQDQRIVAALIRKNMVGAGLTVIGGQLAADKAFDEYVSIDKDTGFVDFGDLDQLGGPMSIILRAYALKKINDMDASPSQKQTLRQDVIMGLYNNQPIIGGADSTIRNLANSRGNPTKFAGQKAANTVIPAGIREWARRADPDPGSKVFGDSRRVNTKPRPVEYYTNSKGERKKRDVPWAEQDQWQVFLNQFKARTPGLRNQFPTQE